MSFYWFNLYRAIPIMIKKLIKLAVLMYMIPAKYKITKENADDRQTPATPKSILNITKMISNIMPGIKKLNMFLLLDKNSLTAKL